MGKTASYCPHVTNMTMAAAAITAVASQPKSFRYQGSVNSPITLGARAHQHHDDHQRHSDHAVNNALTGSKGVKFSAMPATLATISTP